MHRRDFIKVVAGSAVTWPLAARAHHAGRLPTVGFLGATAPGIESKRVSAFVQRLSELGWTEGKNIAIEYRWAEGRNERYAEIAAEFSQMGVDVIVTQGTAAIMAAKRATSVIPIVFAAANDPVGTGLVTSLAQPGANVTGLSGQMPDVAAKRLALLREVAPDLRELAIMANIGSAGTVLEMREAQATASALGLRFTTLEIQRAEDIAPGFERIKDRAQALYVCVEPLVNTNRVRINALASNARLPTMYALREYVEAGGLMSYGPNVPDLYRRAGEFVDKILRGTKPTDIPVEQPTKFELVINLKTARAIGLTVPDRLLSIADELIE